MIKKVSYFLLFLISVILIVGYIRYNPQLEYKNKVPASAETIIHVNLRKVEYAVVKSYLKDPFSYFDFKTPSKKQKDSLKEGKKVSLYSAISIPVNIFFYTNKEEFKGVFISSFFKVKNKLNLASFFKEKKYVKKEKEAITIYEKKSHFFALHKNNLVFVYKRESADIVKLTENIFANTLFMKEEDSLMKRMKKSESDLTLATLENDFLELDISNENLNISGSLGDKFNLFLPYKVEQPKELGIVNVSGKLNTKFLSQKIQQKQKDKFKKLTTLSVDSVLKKWNGDLTFNLSSFSTKTDTIVTYEYDDDFNKIEKRAIEKRVIPDLDLTMSKSTLISYLKEKEVVKKVKGEEIVTIIPFFKVLVNNTNDDLFFYTKKQEKRVIKRKDRFIFSFNVERYMKESDGFYMQNNSYFSSIKNIRLIVSENNNFKLTINLEKTIPNLISQLF